MRTLLINNVRNQTRAVQLAESLVRCGEIDRFFFVAERRDAALETLGISEKRLGRYLHWSDCCAVAICSPGPEYLLYADVDLVLVQPFDWVSTGIEAIESDPTILVANPKWIAADGSSSAEVEADEVCPYGLVGYGFTDQVFLLRRQALQTRLLPRFLPLSVWCPATMRWNGAQGGLFFEQILDGFMRRHRLRRCTIETAQFIPVPMSTYAAIGPFERMRRRFGATALRTLIEARRVFPQVVSSPIFRVSGLLDPNFRRR